MRTTSIIMKKDTKKAFMTLLSTVHPILPILETVLGMQMFGFVSRLLFLSFCG